MADSNLHFNITVDDQLNKVLQKALQATAELEKRLAHIKSMGLGGSGGFAGNSNKSTTRSVAEGVAFGNAAYNVISRAVTSLKNLGNDIMEKGRKQALLRTDINVLAGEAGPQLFKDARKYMSNSLFGPEVYNQVKQMLAFGFKSPEIMPLLKSLGNISGGSQEKMARLTYATSELRAGDVSYRHIRQLMQAGLPADDLAKELKMSTTQLREGIKKHVITGEQLSKAIVRIGNEGRFGGRMDAMMNTPAGQYQQLMTNLGAFKSDLGERILGSLGFHKFLETLKRLFTQTPEFMDRLSKFGSDIFLAFNKIALMFENFTKNGGLDKVVYYLDLIVNNFQAIAITLGSLKLASVFKNTFGGMAGVGMNTKSGMLGGAAFMAGGLMQTSDNKAVGYLGAGLMGGGLAAQFAPMFGPGAPIVIALGALTGVILNWMHNKDSDEQKKASEFFKNANAKYEAESVKTPVTASSNYLKSLFSNKALPAEFLSVFSGEEKEAPTRQRNPNYDNVMGENFARTLLSKQLPSNLMQAISGQLNTGSLSQEKLLSVAQDAYKSSGILGDRVKYLAKSLGIDLSKLGKGTGAGGDGSKLEGKNIDVKGIQPKQIIINIHDGLINNMTNSFASVKEGASEISDIITKAIIDGIHGAELQQSNVPISN